MKTEGENITENTTLNFLSQDNCENSAHTDQSCSSEMEEISSSTDVISDTEAENQYFGDNKMLDESSEVDEAWEDSESKETELRKEHEVICEWMNDKTFRQQNEIECKKLKVEKRLGVFKTNYAIKLIKQHGKMVCLVDTMNLIYVLDKLKLIKTFKFDKWRVSDLEFYNGNLYFCNEKFDKLKEVDSIKSINAECTNQIEIRTINKTLTKNIRKLKSTEKYLYVLGDTSLVVNEEIDVVNEVYDKIIDICEYRDMMFGLNANGDILQYTYTLILENKIVYDEKFSFRKIQAISKYLVISGINGLMFVDENFACVKETKDKTAIVGICERDDKIVYFTDKYNGMKVLSDDLNYVDVKARLPACKKLVLYGSGMLMISQREVHFVRIIEYI